MASVNLLEQSSSLSISSNKSGFSEDITDVFLTQFQNCLPDNADALSICLRKRYVCTFTKSFSDVTDKGGYLYLAKEFIGFDNFDANNGGHIIYLKDIVTMTKLGKNDILINVKANEKEEQSKSLENNRNSILMQDYIYTVGSLRNRDDVFSDIQEAQEDLPKVITVVPDKAEITQRKLGNFVSLRNITYGRRAKLQEDTFSSADDTDKVGKKLRRSSSLNSLTQFSTEGIKSTSQLTVNDPSPSSEKTPPVRKSPSMRRFSSALIAPRSFIQKSIEEFSKSPDSLMKKEETLSEEISIDSKTNSKTSLESREDLDDVSISSTDDPSEMPTEDSLDTTSNKDDFSSNWDAEKLNKKQKEFDRLFKDQPCFGSQIQNTFVCGLVSHTLAHGKMYVSNSHIVFFRKGKVLACIDFKDISIIDRTDSFGLNIAIQIELNNGEEYTFASVSGRDRMYLQVCHIWKEICHSNEVNSITEKQCTCTEHLETFISSDLIGLSLSKLKNQLYKDKEESKWYTNFTVTERGYANWKIDEWESPTSSEFGEICVRTLNYELPVSSPLGNSMAAVEEKQYILQDDDDAFVVQSVNQTPEVPYGKSFFTKMRVCLTVVTPEVTRMKVTFTAEFVKSVFGPIKNTILTSAKGGVKEHMETLVNELHSESGGKPSLDGLLSESEPPDNTEVDSSQTAGLNPLAFFRDLEKDFQVLGLVGVVLIILAMMKFIILESVLIILLLVYAIQYQHRLSQKMERLQEQMNEVTKK